MKNIQHLCYALQAAQQSILDELREQYPIGRELQVKLQSNHIRPVTAVVIDHVGGPDAEIRIQLRHGGHKTVVPVSSVVNSQ